MAFFALHCETIAMKTLIINAALFLSGLVHSQVTPHLVNESLTTDTTILYRGFENHLKLIQDENDANQYTIVGTHCVIIKKDLDGQDLPSNTYIIKTTTSLNSARINLFKHSESGNELVGMQTFAVENLPIPSVCINNVASGNSIDRDPKLIEVKYDSKVAPKVKYDVTGWTVLIDGAIFTGNNYMPTEELKAVVNSISSGTKFEIVVQCRERGSGQEMKFKGIFTIQ